MKKSILLLLQFFLILSLGKVKAQDVEILTPGGIFDTVRDHYGNKYLLSNLRLGSSKLGHNNTVQSIPTVTCSGGYFNLYFAPGSTVATSSSQQSVICQVFKDISGFIQSPLSVSGNTVKINIYCDDEPTLLASATPFLVYPSNPNSLNPGLLENQIFKTISTGVDAYSNLPMGFVNSNAFYHGVVKINQSMSWNTAMNTLTLNPISYDLYTVILHEVTHALGFFNLLNNTGYSKFGSNNNYFSRYDRFLKNSSGVSLLTSTNTSCPNTSLTFTGNPTQIAPGACVNTLTPLDNTNCNNGVRYSSPNTTVTVYTPNCWEPPSSLCHFEDICTTHTNYINYLSSPSCTSGVTPPQNNLYFVMANALGQGSCNAKRFLKEEERYVLCDIGYTVNATYTSAAVIEGTSSSHSYSASLCSSPNISGQNDGIVGGAYVFTTTGTSAVISFSTLLSNDTPSTGLTVSCVESVYNNASVTTGSSTITVTAASGAGFVLLKYVPQSTVTSQFGNVTYVYVYFISGGCNPPNTCNIVQNGGFESINSSYPCGNMPSNARPDCWDPYWITPVIFSRTCGTLIDVLAFNTHNTAPPFDGFGGQPNNHIAGLIANPVGYNGGIAGAAVKNHLSTPLIPGQTYQISLLVQNYSGVGASASGIPANINKSPLVISVASNSVIAFASSSFPSNLNILTEFTVPVSNGWSQITNTFIVASTLTSNQAALIIGIDPVKTSALGVFNSVTNPIAFAVIDEISIVPVPAATFVIPQNPNCGTTTFTNLAQYASAVSGSFSGPGVTYTNSQYHFNSPPTLRPGTYPAVFTYTSANGCSGSIWQSIYIPGIDPGFCNANHTLTAVGFKPGTTYTWSPGALNTVSIVVSPTTATVYTLTANNGTCTLTFTSSPNLTFTPITFTNIIGGWCSGQAPFYLENFLATSTPSGGTWVAPGSYTTIINTNSLVTAVNLNTTVVSNGLYYVNYSYLPFPTSCTVSNNFTVNVISSFSISMGNNAQNCTNLSSGAIISSTANPSPGATYTWQPGSLVGQTQTVTPASNTIYTLTASIPGCSNVTNTIAVTTLSTCCSNSITAFIGSVASSTTYAGTMALNNDITIPSGTNCVLTGEIYIGPTIKITVNNGGALWLQDAHLHACSNNMWTGIVVNDGGQVQTSNSLSTLIEDAVIAIDVSNNYTTTATPILEISNTIFNKNHVSINISNYTSTTNVSPFNITKSIFTCRTLTSSANSWPLTGTTPSISGSNLNLRYATNSTVSLVPPYLGQTGLITASLLAPYAGQTSSVAIRLYNVGTTAYTSGNYNGAQFKGIQIGDATSGYTDYFNLFDNHYNFIYAQNSNVFSYNNMFQNTKTTTLTSSGVSGSAIYSTNTSTVLTFNNVISLNPNVNTNLPNRFWDCHIAVNAQNTYSLNTMHCSFRSTQSTSNTLDSPIQAGYMGIKANTNRFSQYTLDYTEFSNINKGISISIGPGGPFNNGFTSGNGILAGDISIHNCYFGANLTTTTSLGTSYMKKAVDISGFIGVTWTYFGGTGINVSHNGIDRVFNGISLSGLKSINNYAVGNDIKLLDNNITYGLNQRAIEVLNCNHTSVQGNTLAAVTLSNTNLNLVHTASSGSTQILCNQLKDSYRGFAFAGTNPGTNWDANLMKNHIHGMALESAAVIYTQGTVGKPSDNQWLGTWTIGTNFGLYTDGTAAASLSTIYYKTAYTPTNVGGQTPALDYNQSGGLIPTTGTYVCSSFDGVGGGWSSYPRDVKGPRSGDYPNNNYAAGGFTSVYRYLHAPENDSLRENIPELHDFYYGLAGSAFAAFVEIEGDLYGEEISSAASLLSTISPTNDVETNYKTFYNLYINFVNNDDSLSSSDSATLYTLAHLCPEENGACVYQARAFYKALYNGLGDYADDCSADEGRSAVTEANSINKKIHSANPEWTVDLYPNPASTQVTVRSKANSEELNLIFKDIYGRTTLFQNVKTNRFLVTLDLTLINGIYFVTITNSKNEATTKKLVISR